MQTCHTFPWLTTVLMLLLTLLDGGVVVPYAATLSALPLYWTVCCLYCVLCSGAKKSTGAYNTTSTWNTKV